MLQFLFALADPEVWFAVTVVLIVVVIVGEAIAKLFPYRR